MNPEIVITGRGVVTALGNTVDELWQALCAGRSGIRPIQRFDASALAVRIAAEADAGDTEPWHSRWKLFPLTRPGIFALTAASAAVKEAGLTHRAGPLGVYLGCGGGDFEQKPFLESAAEHLASGGGVSSSYDVLDPATLMFSSPLDASTLAVAEMVEADGPCATIATACAAGAQAIAAAVESLQRGDATVAVCGGCDSMIDPLSLICFDKLGVLSRCNEEPERAMRPFDQSRTGFVMGEGAGILVLETREHARQRGARVLGGILGIATAGDAYRITDTPPEGEGARHAMRQALANAQLRPSDIDYINAHGTGTWLNDISECRAIRAVFEDQVQRIPVSSTKAALGHMIAAAGAVEAIICLEALRTAIIPPTLNLRDADAQCAVRHVYQAEGGPLRSALSNSFGFGGNNVSVVLTTYDG